MKNGTILLQKPNWELTKNIQDRVIKVIQFITSSKYHHVVVYNDGYYWESTVWNVGKKMYHGVKKSKYKPFHSTVLEPVKDLTSKEVKDLTSYLEGELLKGVPYNFFKLISLALIYPTRWFWKLIGWVPFSNTIFGEVCSTFIDEAFYKIGRDILPDAFHGYTAPVDFLRTIEANTFRQVVE